MKRDRNRLLVLFLPTLLLAGLAGAFQSDGAAPSPAAPGEEEIVERMEIISSVMKRLRRSIEDETKRAESLETLVEAERAALEVKQLTPPMTATLPEAERPAFVAAFRKTIAELITKMLELEVALIDGDQAKIAEAYKRVRAMEDSGHERFTEDG